MKKSLAILVFLAFMICLTQNIVAVDSQNARCGKCICPSKVRHDVCAICCKEDLHSPACMNCECPKINEANKARQEDVCEICCKRNVYSPACKGCICLHKNEEEDYCKTDCCLHAPPPNM